MSLGITFLGTSASRPTVERNVTAIAVVREGETLLFDCGEGTQRQMMRYGVSFALEHIFFTHFHADHIIGVIGLLRTMALQGRTAPLTVWGPKGASRIMRRAEGFGLDRLPFNLVVEELVPGGIFQRKDYAVVAFEVDHAGASALGYTLVEAPRRGRFNRTRAEELGIPEGPLWGDLHRGRPVTLADGTLVDPAAIVGPERPGRRVVITGDSRPADATISAAEGADLLIHEATFGTEEAARAIETGHSTAREAAEVATKAGAHRLVLTHFSARYSRDPSELEREAREVFPNTITARDGMEVDVPFVDADTPAAASARP